MQNMVYFDPNFQHYQHQHEQQIGQQVLSHFDAQHMHNYALAHQNAQLMAMPPAKTNETKPRLGKDEVDILEREFRQNPKPTTKVKREFAREMGVELPRINVCIESQVLGYVTDETVELVSKSPSKAEAGGQTAGI
jgi:hypothetical protein